MSNPEAGWYPDPTNPIQRRYWDGDEWTELEMSEKTFRQQHRKQRRNTRTRLVFAGGLTLVLIAGAALITAAWHDGHRRDGAAAQVATSFLELAATNDDSWREYSSALMRNTYLDASPLQLDPATAGALKMQVDYREGDLVFVRSVAPNDSVKERDADTASMVIKLTYEWDAGGESHTYTATQELWLTRAFYYGDAVADRADPDRRPTAIGPWQATMLSFPERVNGGSLTDLEAGDRGYQETCRTVGKVFEQLSTAARQRGNLASSCWLTSDGYFVRDESLDTQTLIDEMPVYNEYSPPDSALRIRTYLEGRPLLAQYPIETSAGTYVVTLGASSLDGTAITDSNYQLRILSIQLEEAQ